MSRISRLDRSEVSPEIAALYDKAFAQRGNVPNMFRVMAHRPEIFATMQAHFGAVLNTGTVPTKLKELIIVRTSQVNETPYCLASHTILARKLGWTDDQLAHLADWPQRDDFTPAEKAALRLAETVTRDAHAVSDEQFAELRSFYSEGEIVELLCAIGLFNYFNRFNNALKMEPTKPGEGGCPRRRRRQLQPRVENAVLDRVSQSATPQQTIHRCRIQRRSSLVRMKLKLPAGDFRAYLFDCDGTIVDSMPLHYIAWKKALGEWNCPFDEELFYAWGGMPAVEIIAALNQMQGLKMPVEAVAERKENLYYDLLSAAQAGARGARAHRSAAWPHSLRRRLRQQPRVDHQDRSPPCICSTISTSSSAQKTTSAASLLPMPFCLPPSGSALRPKDCLVFEDTEMGIQAATAAGMASVRVPSPARKTHGTAASSEPA